MIAATISNELRENLTKMSHDSWIGWSQHLAKELIQLCNICKSTGDIEAIKFIDNILQRWNKSWKDYSELDEINKDKDRILANKILELIR